MVPTCAGWSTRERHSGRRRLLPSDRYPESAGWRRHRSRGVERASLLPPGRGLDHRRTPTASLSGSRAPAPGHPAYNEEIPVRCCTTLSLTPTTARRACTSTSRSTRSIEIIDSPGRGSPEERRPARQGVSNVRDAPSPIRTARHIEGTARCTQGAEVEEAEGYRSRMERAGPLVRVTLKPHPAAAEAQEATPADSRKRKSPEERRAEVIELLSTVESAQGERSPSTSASACEGLRNDRRAVAAREIAPTKPARSPDQRYRLTQPSEN